MSSTSCSRRGRLVARAQLGVGFGAKAPGSHDQRSRSIVSQVDAPIECHGFRSHMLIDIARSSRVCFGRATSSWMGESRCGFPMPHRRLVLVLALCRPRLSLFVGHCLMLPLEAPLDPALPRSAAGGPASFHRAPAETSSGSFEGVDRARKVSSRGGRGTRRQAV